MLGVFLGYYVIIYGFFVGELVCRVMNKMFGVYFKVEFVVLFDVDFYIGLFESEEYCIVEMIVSFFMFVNLEEMVNLDIRKVVFVNFFMLLNFLNECVWCKFEIFGVGG